MRIGSLLRGIIQSIRFSISTVSIMERTLVYGTNNVGSSPTRCAKKRIKRSANVVDLFSFIYYNIDIQIVRRFRK